MIGRIPAQALRYVANANIFWPIATVSGFVFAYRTPNDGTNAEMARRARPLPMEPVEFDDSIQDTTTIVGAIVIVIAVTCVALRFYTRRITRAGLGWDDWLVLLALVITIVSAILLFVASSIDPNGAKAASNTDPDYVYTPADVAYTRLDFIVTVLYFTVTSATKLSILLMYRRIFGVNRSFRRRVFVVSLVVGGFWIGTTVADLLNCIPLQWSWLNSHDDPRYCFNYTIFWLASGIVEAILDVIILTLPIQSVLGLHLKTSRKVAIGGVFLLGSLVIVSGIVKVVLSYEPGNREPSFSKTEKGREGRDPGDRYVLNFTSSQIRLDYAYV
ncbi:hypothetical protein F5Y14DRAFT_449467 [Nemania sp. NC0429]|nr:hypothetical protein F5Y14DRAFT_449467 [Nemania sp. NC0429]